MWGRSVLSSTAFCNLNTAQTSHPTSTSVKEYHILTQVYLGMYYVYITILHYITYFTLQVN